MEILPGKSWCLVLDLIYLFWSPNHWYEILGGKDSLMAIIVVLANENVYSGEIRCGVYCT